MHLFILSQYTYILYILYICYIFSYVKHLNLCSLYLYFKSLFDYRRAISADNQRFILILNKLVE